MARCQHCQSYGFKIEKIRASGDDHEALCCAGCGAVIHVFERRGVFYYGTGIEEIIRELKSINSRLELLAMDKL